MRDTLRSRTTDADMHLLRTLIGDAFKRPELLPITYDYNGKTYHGLPENAKVSRQFVDANRVKTVWTSYLDQDVQISTECLEFRDFPVVEWIVWFRNVAGTDQAHQENSAAWTISRDSAILSDVSAIDFFFAGKEPVLTANNGDFYDFHGYTPMDIGLTPGSVWTQSPTGGRSCNEAYPYQRLMFDGFGLNIAIGWPGEWTCRYEGCEGGVVFQAGQKVVHTVLKPGESLRTPRMTLMTFHGDAVRGINIWRRWFTAHILPRQYGQPLKGKRICMENGGGIEFTEATEENQLRGLDRIKACDITCDLWWIDAGWYPCYQKTGIKEWPHTGTWHADPARFPAGLAPVGQKCAELDIDLLLWCEPERVRPDTWLADNHPEWLLQTNPPSFDRLLNLSDPDCLDWLCHHFDQLIKDYGVKCYRQDFNFPPLQFWRDNEAENRAGMIENQYVQGYLAYWDYLLLHNPDLFIDSCSSGGRRNDLESLRRAVPLHHTDYGYGHHPVNQAFHHTLNSWIPYYRGFMLSWDDEQGNYDQQPVSVPDGLFLDNFTIINSICPAITVGNPNLLIEKTDKLPYLRLMLEIWEKASPLMIHGDFYALTPNHRDQTQWTVFQFDDPENGRGLFKVIRNNRCDQPSLVVAPVGFIDSADAVYLLENPETGESWMTTGRDINQSGLTFTLPIRSGAIWFYKMK